MNTFSRDSLQFLSQLYASQDWGRSKVGKECIVTLIFMEILCIFLLHFVCLLECIVLQLPGLLEKDLLYFKLLFLLLSFRTTVRMCAIMCVYMCVCLCAPVHTHMEREKARKSELRGEAPELSSILYSLCYNFSCHFGPISAILVYKGPLLFLSAKVPTF